MSDCTRYRRLLVAYADGDLDDATRQDVAAHLEGCPGCREEALGWERDAPMLGHPRMSQRFWRSREDALLDALGAQRPFWRRWLDLLTAPMPVPRYVAFAAAILVVWLAGRAPVPEPVPARSSPRPVLEFEALARPGADVG